MSQAQSQPGHSETVPGSRPRHWILLLALVALFGSAFMMIKVGVETIPPMTLVFIRLVIAAVVLIVMARMRGLHIPAPVNLSSGRVNHLWVWFFVMAITGNALPFTLISWGSQYVPSNLAGILMAVMPLTTMAFAAMFIPGEHVTVRKLAGFTLGLVGIVVLFGPDALGLADDSRLLAQLAIVLGALSYATNAIITKKMPQCPALVAGAIIHVLAALQILPLALIWERPFAIDPSAESLLSALGLGVLSSAAATLVLLELIRTAGPTFTSQVNYLIPLWAVFMGFMFLGEIPHWSAVAALVIILGGIAVSQPRRTQGQPVKP